jgi:hypothetical protein
MVAAERGRTDPWTSPRITMIGRTDARSGEEGCANEAAIAAIGD